MRLGSTGAERLDAEAGGVMGGPESANMPDIMGDIGLESGPAQTRNALARNRDSAHVRRGAHLARGQLCTGNSANQAEGRDTPGMSPLPLG